MGFRKYVMPGSFFMFCSCFVHVLYTFQSLRQSWLLYICTLWCCQATAMVLAIPIIHFCFPKVIKVYFSPISMSYDCEIYYLGTNMFLCMPQNREHHTIQSLTSHQPVISHHPVNNQSLHTIQSFHTIQSLTSHYTPSSDQPVITHHPVINQSLHTIQSLTSHYTPSSH